MNTLKNKSHNKKRNKRVETKVSENDNQDEIVISDELKQKYFVYQPYFNFKYAEEELGFNFSDFAQEGFGDFLHTVYVCDLIQLRKAYIMRDYNSVRFLAHKFKSPFR